MTEQKLFSEFADVEREPVGFFGNEFHISQVALQRLIAKGVKPYQNWRFRLAVWIYSIVSEWLLKYMRKVEITRPGGYS